MQKTPLFSLRGKKVWVAGHKGMVGSAVAQRLDSEDCEVLTVSRSELDLRNQEAVERWMIKFRPDVVVLSAAKVGGIMANNSYPVDFLYDNLMIETNIISSAWKAGVSKLLFLGSSCIYPKFALQPIKESALLSGPLEPTNHWYAIAKISGIMLCQAYRRQYECDFISAMPTKLYGPNDNFDLVSSHVLPALMRKFHEAKVAGTREGVIWGTGTPRREFLHVDDLADACVFIMERYEDAQHINVGTGEDVSIRELAETLRDLIYPDADLVFDTTKPDGMPRKLLDVSRLHALGWRHRIELREGVAATYRWFLENQSQLRTGAARARVNA